MLRMLLFFLQLFFYATRHPFFSKKSLHVHDGLYYNDYDYILYFELEDVTRLTIFCLKFILTVGQI